MVTARDMPGRLEERSPGAGCARLPLVRWLMVAQTELTPAAARLNYWRNIRRVTVILLVVWLAVTLALPWFATDLNQVRIGRFPLGFWMSAQGAVGIYVVLIVAYIWAVEMIEDAWHDAVEAVDPDGAPLEVVPRRRVDD